MAKTTQDLHEQFEPHPDTKKPTGHGDGVHGVEKDVDFEPRPENSSRISTEHQKVIEAITNLYSGSASEKDMQIYAEKAIYDDPFSYCDTRFKIAGQWYGLPVIFGKLETKSVEMVQDTNELIVFKMRHEYMLKGIHASRKVDSLVSLSLDPAGKVRYHKDQWNEKDYSHEGFGKVFKKLNGDYLSESFDRYSAPCPQFRFTDSFTPTSQHYAASTIIVTEGLWMQVAVLVLNEGLFDSVRDGQAIPEHRLLFAACLPWSYIFYLVPLLSEATQKSSIGLRLACTDLRRVGARAVEVIYELEVTEEAAKHDKCRPRARQVLPHM